MPTFRESVFAEKMRPQGALGGLSELRVPSAAFAGHSSIAAPFPIRRRKSRAAGTRKT